MEEQLKRPIFLTAVLVSLSIIVYKYMGFGIFVVALLLCLALCAVLIKRLSFILIIICIFLGVLLSLFNVKTKTDNSVNLSGADFTLKFVTVSQEKLTENAKCITVKTTNDNSVLSDTKFNLYYRNENLSIGQKISANVDFMEFDKTDYSINNGIYGSLWLKSIEKENGYSKFYKSLGDVRNYIKGFLKSNLNYENYTTVASIILGDKSMLDDSFYDLVKASGVSHIMAVSGLHLSVILSLLFLIFSRLIFNRYIKFLFSSISIFVIAAICGFTPSVIRAGLMFLIIAFADLMSRDTDALSVISFAVLIILSISPLLLFNISFQMSVLAIISIMYVTPFYLKLWLKYLPKSKPLKAFVSAVAVSLFAHIFTMPVAIYNFACVSLVSVLTNIFITVPTNIIIQLTVFGIMFSFINPVSFVLMKAVDVLTLYVRFIIVYFGNLKYSAVTVPKYFCLFPIIPIIFLLALKTIIERREYRYGNNRRRNTD